MKKRVSFQLFFTVVKRGICQVLKSVAKLFGYKEGTTFNENIKTIAVYIYNHFHALNPNYGYSAAASVLLFFVTSILGSFCFAMNRDKDAAKRKQQIKEAKKRMKQQNKATFGGF